MLKLIFLTIILYIIIQHFMEEPDTDRVLPKIKEETIKSPQVIPLNKVKDGILNNTPKNRMGVTGINNPPKILSEAKSLIRLETDSLNSTNSISDTQQNSNNEPRIMTFDKPNPWSKIIIVPLEEFPYFFHIKAKVSSLNDFEAWKQVIPNINFDPRDGELIIPSKDEPSALAIANLILINFSGQMTLQNILEKNLIQISIAKAKSYEPVQNKLREQIMENLYGTQFNLVQTNYQQDLAVKKPVQNSTPQIPSNPDRIDFTSESFVDTFDNFSNNLNGSSNDVDAWDRDVFSYL